MNHNPPRYNYQLNLWTVFGIIQDCQHPIGHECTCLGRQWQGQTLQQVEQNIQLHLIEI